ncbi:MAG: HK97-fold major capsid protein [Candidatus Paceibacterota bacterium]|jgi:hypothetical protein
MDKLTLIQKERILGNLLSSEGGRKVLAQKLQMPLRRRLDYMGVIRKAFMVDELPPGALPYYDKDPSVSAMVIPEDSTSPTPVVKGTRVAVPLKEIGVCPMIPIVQLKERRYSHMERVQDLARQEIQAVEDESGFAAIDAACDINTNTDIAITGDRITRDALTDAFAEVEKNDLRVARCFFNPRDYADIRKFGRDQIDPVHQAAIIDTGLQAEFWGAQLITSRIVPQGTVYICTDGPFLGVLPIRIDLTVLPADKPWDRMVGWSIFEQVGFGVTNNNGANRLTITRT